MMASLFSNSCFATLTPDNPKSQKSLVALIDKQPVLAQGEPVIPLALPRNATDCGSAPTDQLVLSFEKRGSGRNGGWRMGKYGQGVDLPVCSPKSRCLKERFFCDISIHPQSGAIILQNCLRDEPIIYLIGDGHADIELQSGDQHVLHMPVNYLRIGPLHYKLEFCIDDEEIYIAQRNEYMSRQFRDWNPPPSLDPLPRPEHVRTNNILIHHDIGSGAFGLVRIAVDMRSGAILACKTVPGNKPDKLAVIENELNIARSIPAGAAGLMPLLRSWCDHDLSWPCFRRKVETIYLLMPYAPFTFRSAPWHHMSLYTRLVLLRQVLEGLANLHAMGIMHRDISLLNLLVFWPRDSPPSAVIGDFGKAKRGATGKGTSLGPPAFTAPEVGTQLEYTMAIDMFSLGLCFLLTFRESEDQWTLQGPMTKEHHATALERLQIAQSRMPERLCTLIQSMLAWDPAVRPTPQEALADELWLQIDEATSEIAGTNSAGSESNESPGVTRQRRSEGLPPSSGQPSKLKTRVQKSTISSLSRGEVAIESQGSRPGRRKRKTISSSRPSPPPTP